METQPTSEVAVPRWEVKTLRQTLWKTVQADAELAEHLNAGWEVVSVSTTPETEHRGEGRDIILRRVTEAWKQRQASLIPSRGEHTMYQLSNRGEMP